jgi:hypothetical protein
MTATLVRVATALLLAVAMPDIASAQKTTHTPGVTCSHWYGICKSRGGSDSNCGNRRANCLASGCFQEGPKYGNDRWCSLSRK